MHKLGIGRWRGILLATMSLAFSQPVYAADHVWVIGGGPDAYDGGFQIEYNVNWVLEVLRNTPGERELHIYFGAGNSEAKDVVEWSPPADGIEQLQPLARIYGNQFHNGESYRHNLLTDITGSTSQKALTQSLQLDFSKLESGDRAFIVYNGHGTYDPNDSGENSLRLWGDSYLSAREFESLLSEIEPSVPTRFLFPQCYSGGFARLIHPQGDDVLELAEGNRCGFMASSERRQSEGCASSTKLGDYRDYTTHFFAAFSGVTKQGEAVTGNVDLDDDGEVTMFDAHLFALRDGYSRSMPRATSETYLEKWQPWYLRWIGTSDELDNVYGRLARDVARNLELPESGPELMKEVRRRRAALQDRQSVLESEKQENETRIEQLQDGIQEALESEYPEVRYPYTRNFMRFLAMNLETAQQLIMQHPDYEQLADLQNGQPEIDASVLGVERDTIELDKVLRLRKLARLQEQFEAHASDTEQDALQKLMMCETSAF